MQQALLCLFSIVLFNCNAQLRLDSVLHEKREDSSWAKLGIKTFDYYWYNCVKLEEYKSWNDFYEEYIPSSLNEFDYDNLYRMTYAGTSYWNRNDSSYEKVLYSEMSYQADSAKNVISYSFDYLIGFYKAGVSRIVYNSNGQILKVQNGSSIQEYVYNSNGNLIEYKSGNSRVYHFYNTLGQRDSSLAGSLTDSFKISSAAVYEYHTNGKLHKTKTSIWHPFQNLILRKREDVYTYNDDQELSEHLYKVSNTSFKWVDVKRWVYHYSEKANTQLLLELYPRPANSELHFNNTLNASEYGIFAVNGKLIEAGKLTEGINDFNTANLADGMYVFRVIGEFGLLAEKILIAN